MRASLLSAIVNPKRTKQKYTLNKSFNKQSSGLDFNIRVAAESLVLYVDIKSICK